ncbi:MAG: hypothetical protein M3N93_00775 [Acidobacteriota bacterium]|nr:hypothetical protein [Acidobacteriota bacterium]
MAFIPNLDTLPAPQRALWPEPGATPDTFTLYGGTPEQVRDMPLHIASLLDIAGTRAAVVQKRAEVKDYLDIDALLQQGIDLPTVLAAGMVVYGRPFNPLITLKALSFLMTCRR